MFEDRTPEPNDAAARGGPFEHTLGNGPGQNGVPSDPSMAALQELQHCHIDGLVAGSAGWTAKMACNHCRINGSEMFRACTHVNRAGSKFCDCCRLHIVEECTADDGCVDFIPRPSSSSWPWSRK
jgi:hypothetical protein